MRAVGKDANGVETVVDEFIFKFTHSIVMDWMLPGIQPTNKKVSCCRLQHTNGML
jgi:hypothetical protein